MSSAQFNAPSYSAPTVPDYVPADWSAQHGTDKATEREAMAAAVADALSGMGVTLDGRQTIGALKNHRAWGGRS